MGRFDQIGVGIEMDQRQRTMFFSVGFERRIAGQMISAEAKRGHVAVDHLRHRLCHRGDHIVRPPGE
jgi:hypothetical protein